MPGLLPGGGLPSPIRALELVWATSGGSNVEIPPQIVAPARGEQSPAGGTDPDRTAGDASPTYPAGRLIPWNLFWGPIRADSTRARSEALRCSFPLSP